jgi:DNA repair exonuclease SbcCD ATPase subunit
MQPVKQLMAIPSVMQGLIETEDGKVFELDSPKGAGWLESIGSFRFEPRGDSKPYTVRKEASGYWYGCRKVAGKVRKKYIGKSSEVSIAKLEEIAAALEVPPVPRVKQVAEVAQEVAQVAEVAQDRLIALELEVANLRKALEALQEALPGKLESGDSAELPKVDSEVAEELQNRLSKLKAEPEDIDFLKRLLAKKDPLISSDLWQEIERLKERNRQLRLKIGAERRESIEKISDLEDWNKGLTRRVQEKQARLDELEAQLETERANREEVEAELAALAQLEKEAKEAAAEIHAEGRAIEVERIRWQQELSDARGELAEAKATILNQGNKIRELERGYSLKPNPAPRRLRLEIGELRSELSDLKQKSAAASKDLPEAADLLNQLKAKRKKSKTDLADLEVILEILES